METLWAFLASFLMNNSPFFKNWINKNAFVYKVRSAAATTTTIIEISLLLYEMGRRKNTIQK